MLKPAKLIKFAATLNADDSLNWSVLDHQSELSPEFPPPFPEFGHQISLQSGEGMAIDVSVPTGNLVRINQNHFFPGTFDIGEKLLFTGFSNPGALVLDFSHSLYGVGFSVQSDPQVPSGTPGPFPFDVVVKAFDNHNKNLGEFNLSGLSKIEAASETTFVGMFQEKGEIAKISIEVIENGVSIPFAINMLKLRVQYTFVPEMGFRNLREFIAHLAK